MNQDSPWYCEHKEVNLVQRKYSNGSTHFVEQCKRCGGSTRSVKKSLIDAPGALPHYDDDLVSKFNKRAQKEYKIRQGEREREYQSRKEKESKEWFEWYNKYLASDKWRDKRSRVLQRDKGVCQACLNREALQVHHLTYEHVGNEPLFDLVSVCEICHKGLHNDK